MVRDFSVSIIEKAIPAFVILLWTLTSFSKPQCNVVFSGSLAPARSLSQTFKISDGWTLQRSIREADELTVETIKSTHTLFPNAKKEISRPLHSIANTPSETTKLILQRDEGKTEVSSKKLEDISEIVESSENIAYFLGQHYSRRRWSTNFSKNKVANPDTLTQVLPASYRVAIHDSTGNIVGTGAIIYSPFLKIIDATTGDKVILPWITREDFLKRANTHDWTPPFENPFQLPIESFFGVDLLRENTVNQQTLENFSGEVIKVSIGMHAELASFAIDRNSPLRDRALEEIFYEFILASYHSPFRLHYSVAHTTLAQISQTPKTQQRPLYFTYGDKVGRRLYSSKPFSFEEFPALRTDAHGVSWSPLNADGGFLQRFARQKSFSVVAQKAFSELLSRGIRVDQPQNYDTGQRSQAEELSDIFRHMDFVEQFTTK